MAACASRNSLVTGVSPPSGPATLRSVAFGTGLDDGSAHAPHVPFHATMSSRSIASARGILPNLTAVAVTFSRVISGNPAGDR